MASSSPINAGDPALGAKAITPSDSVELSPYVRAIYCGSAGNIQILTAYDETTVFVAVPAGAVLPVRAKKVFSTNTTASSLVGLY